MSITIAPQKKHSQTSHQASSDLLPAIAEASGLMKGVPQEKHRAVLRCLNASVQELNEHESFVNQADSVNLVHYLAKGSLRLERIDPDGNRSILSSFDAGALAGKSMTPSFYESDEMSLKTSEPSTAISFSIVPEVETCSCCIKYISVIRRNLIESLTAMNAKLIKNAESLSCRSTREKVLRYLEDQAKELGRSTFEIPYNRQEFADLLCVERSALSRELGRMRDDGLIAFERNTFSLLP